jgi:DnaJ-class molecular chaperone
MKICQTCNGNKMINGMGYIKEKCKKCDGKGFITELAVVKEATAVKEMDTVKKSEPLKVKAREKQKNVKNVKNETEKPNSKYFEQKGTDL